MAVLRIGALPEAALAAAAEFHARVLAEVTAELQKLKPLPFRGGVEGGACPVSTGLADSPHPNPSPEGEGLLLLIFPPAVHTHRAWRLAAIQSLAREYAPIRVNALTSDSEAAIAGTCAYLERAEGVTGQLLELDDTGAGEVVTSSI